MSQTLLPLCHLGLRTLDCPPPGKLLDGRHVYGPLVLGSAKPLAYRGFGALDW